MKMNPVVHFEMPSKNKKRVAKFYKQAFGWGMQILGPEMGNYVRAHHGYFSGRKAGILIL